MTISFVWNAARFKRFNGRRWSAFKKKPANRWGLLRFFTDTKFLVAASHARNVMGKKNKPAPAAPPAPVKPLISRRGCKVIGGGIGLLIIGYFVLSKADSMGQNWAATLSPFLILGGYAAIGIGIVLKDPAPNPS